MDVEQARAAREAFMRFGKGRHAAGLNFGDCFPYAPSRVLGEPLLFKGDDFGRTDVTPFAPGANPEGVEQAAALRGSENGSA